MFPKVALDTVRFAEAAYLWLLVVPVALAVLWAWRFVRRRGDIQKLRSARVLPLRERYTLAGDLAFWLCALVAASLCIVALARPEARITAVRQGSADIVILQDASASMYVSDVRPDRWRRSISFLRTFAESLSWHGDRVALALFAQLAAPQVRLTRDPNSLFFFIDHLGEHSPFPLENATTWDTNIEEGIRWGLRLVEKDEELFGSSGNPKAFVVISDGQAWSGKVATVLQSAKARNIPVHVVGVGTTVGGMIPEPVGPDGTRPSSTIRSILDRQSLLQIAVTGGGEYFEIGDEADQTVAFRIVNRLRSRADTSEAVESVEELHRFLLMGAAVMLCLGALLLRKPVELTWHAAATLAAVLLLASLI